MRPALLCRYVSLCLLAIAVGRAQAMFMIMDKDVPLATLLPQLEKHVQANPKDAHAHYLLGRVHSLAWATSGDQVRLVPAEKEEGLPRFAVYASLRVSRQKEEAPSPDALKHLQQSIDGYRKAVELDSKNGLYHLGLAWMLEQQLASSAKEEGKKIDDSAARLKEVIDTYVKAFELRFDADVKSEDRLMAGDAFVSAEAAENAVRLIRTTKQPDEALIKRLEEGRNKVFEKGMAVTPVIVALQERMGLADLVNEKASVPFDLAGLDSGHRWPWVTPNAGVLVWDPQATGQITSGRQLFGNMTWQMLFRDGYEALSALDADRDGQLQGSELNGIGLWRDANENAVSDPGEVVSIDQAGIRSLKINATRDVTGILQHAGGVMWKDGRTTTSYDWVPESK